MPGLTQTEVGEFIQKKSARANLNEHEQALLLKAAEQSDAQNNLVWSPYLLQVAGDLLLKKRAFPPQMPDYLPENSDYQKLFIEHVRTKYKD